MSADEMPSADDLVPVTVVTPAGREVVVTAIEAAAMGPEQLAYADRIAAKGADDDRAAAAAAEDGAVLTRVFCHRCGAVLARVRNSTLGPVVIADAGPDTPEREAAARRRTRAARYGGAGRVPPAVASGRGSTTVLLNAGTDTLTTRCPNHGAVLVAGRLLAVAVGRRVDATTRCPTHGAVLVAGRLLAVGRRVDATRCRPPGP